MWDCVEVESLISGVVGVSTQIVAVGGFPGSGKSSVAARLAEQLRMPVLGSDLLGNTIKATLAEHAPGAVPSSVAFRAGYATLFALVEEFVSHGCSVVVDMSLGWPFQWDQLDGIRDRVPRMALRPFILECSDRTCSARLRARHRRDPEHHPAVQDFLQQPQLAGVRDFLATVDRPDLRRIDAEPPVDQVVDEICRLLSAGDRADG